MTDPINKSKDNQVYLRISLDEKELLEKASLVVGLFSSMPSVPLW